MDVTLTPTADESAVRLATLIEREEPFVFMRLGDADLYVMYERPPFGTGGSNGNGESSPRGVLGPQLFAAWHQLADAPHLLIGDFASRSIGLQDLAAEQAEVMGWLPNAELVASEALIFHRSSPALRRFYEAARIDQRRKVYVAAASHEAGATLLGSNWLEVPDRQTWQEADEVVRRVLDGGWEVVYASVGLATVLLAAGLVAANPAITFLHLGSAFDPLYCAGPTRTGQLAGDEVRELLRGLDA